MNKQEFIDAVSNKTGISKKDCGEILEACYEVLAEAFSTIFELDYNTVLEKVNSDSSSITIAKKPITNIATTFPTSWNEISFITRISANP